MGLSGSSTGRVFAPLTEIVAGDLIPPFGFCCMESRRSQLNFSLAAQDNVLWSLKQSHSGYSVKEFSTFNNRQIVNILWIHFVSGKSLCSVAKWLLLIIYDSIIMSLLILMHKCASSILIKLSGKFNQGRISKCFLYLSSLSFCPSFSVSFSFQLTQLSASSLSVKPIGFASHPVSQSYSCC